MALKLQHEFLNECEKLHRLYFLIKSRVDKFLNQEFLEDLVDVKSVEFQMEEFELN